MRHWPYFLSAIVHEVAPTLSLRASFGHVLWIAVVVIGYAGAFACLAVMMRLGALIGVVYAIWAAVARTGPMSGGSKRPCQGMSKAMNRYRSSSC